jgi:hypothetical protein
MKKTILLVMMLTLAAFVSGAIAVAPPAPATTTTTTTTTTAPVKMEKFWGALKSVDAMAKSIVVVKGKVEKSFMVTADTKIMKGKEAIKLEDLQAGAHVHIAYVKEMDKNVAATINAFAPNAHPKEK